MMREEQISVNHIVKVAGRVFVILLPLSFLMARFGILALLGMVGILFGLVLFLYPHLGTYVFIFSFPVLAAVPRGFLIPLVKLDEILIVVTLLCVLVQPNRFKWRITLIDYIYLMLLCAGILIPMAGVQLRGGTFDWFELITPLKQLAIYRLLMATLQGRKRVSAALTWLLIPALGVAIVGVLQLMGVFNMQFLLSKIYYDTSVRAVGNVYFRATSTLGDWNALGGYAALGGLLSLALTRYRHVLKQSWIVWLAMIANLSLLMMAGSSSSWFGFFFGVIIWWLAERKRGRLRIRKHSLVWGILVGIILLVFFVGLGRDVLVEQLKRQITSHVYDRASGTIYSTYGLPASVVGRWALARYLYKLIIEDRIAIVTGFGSEAIELLPWGTAESGYMEMLFFYGPIYLLAYLVLLWVISRKAQRFRGHVGTDDDLGVGLSNAVIAIVSAIFVMNIIYPYYTAAGVTHYFWIIVGCFFALKLCKKSDPGILGGD